MRGRVLILLFGMAVLLAPAFGQQPPQAQNQQGPRGLGGRNTPTFAGLSGEPVTLSSPASHCTRRS